MYHMKAKISIVVLGIIACIVGLIYIQSPTKAETVVYDGGKRPRVLDKWAVGGSVTGTTTETSIRSYTIPGGTIKVGDVLRITAAWSWTNNANTKTPRVRIGTSTGATGVTYISQQQTTNFCIKGQYDVYFRAASSQLGVQGTGGSAGWSAGSAQVTSTLDENSAIVVDFTGQDAVATDSTTLEGYTIELM